MQKVSCVIGTAKNLYSSYQYNKFKQKPSNVVSFCRGGDLGGLDHKFLPYNPKIPFTDNNTPSDKIVIKIRNELDTFLNKNGLGLPAYFEDKISNAAKEEFLKHFGTKKVYFVPSGTAANVLALMSVSQNGSIILPEVAHPLVNENLAIPSHMCSNIIKVPSYIPGASAMSVHDVEKAIGTYPETSGYNHMPKPKAIFITQPTELGALYSIENIKEIADFAHSQTPKIYLIMDGARLSNAAAALGVSFKELTMDPGVDIVTFGLTKNGASGGTAVVFLNDSIVKNIEEQGDSLEGIIKRKGWMVDKGWYNSLEYWTLLKNNRCIKNAKRANKMAKSVSKKIQDRISWLKPIKDNFCQKVEVTNLVETNAVFIKLNIADDKITELTKKYNFYVWGRDGRGTIIRIMTSFITDYKKHIRPFINDLKRICGK